MADDNEDLDLMKDLPDEEAEDLQRSVAGDDEEDVEEDEDVATS